MWAVAFACKVRASGKALVSWNRMNCRGWEQKDEDQESRSSKSVTPTKAKLLQNPQLSLRIHPCICHCASWRFHGHPRSEGRHLEQSCWSKMAISRPRVAMQVAANECNSANRAAVFWQAQRMEPPCSSCREQKS